MTSGPATVVAGEDERSLPPGIDPAPLELRDSLPWLDGAALPGPAARAALIERLRLDGYLLFRGLVPGDDLAALQRDVASVLATERVVVDRSLRTLDPVPVFASDRYVAVLRRLIALESLHRAAYHAAVIGLMRVLTAEDEIVVHPRKVIRLCHPHRLDAMSTTGVHQDYTYVQGGADGLTVWLPLTDAPRERGALAVLVGSAVEGLRPVRDAVGPCGSGPTLARPTDAARWGSTDFAPGDVLVMHGFTVHRALPNLTDHTRVSLDLRYRAASQTLTLPEMWPPHHPELGDWSELTDGWSSTEWLAMPPGVRLVGARAIRKGLTAPASAMLDIPERVVPPV